jgi:anaerobic ribonucleoside-triphosphate reductase activating protein
VNKAAYSGWKARDSTAMSSRRFAQSRELTLLAMQVRAAGLSVFVFTGHDLHELARPEHRALLADTDVLVAGRYVEAQRATGLREPAGPLPHRSLRPR